MREANIAYITKQKQKRQANDCRKQCPCRTLCGRPGANELSTCSPESTFLILPNFIGDQAPQKWATFSLAKGRYVQEHPRACAVLDDETKTAFIIPLDDSSLKSHVYKPN